LRANSITITLESLIKYLKKILVPLLADIAFVAGGNLCYKISHDQ